MRRRVADARVARLATVRPDGRPHVVPIVFALEGDTLYSTVDGKPKGTARLQRLRNVDLHPAVELVVDHYAEAWDEVWWVRLTGLARAVREGPDRDRGHALLREKYPQYRTWGPLGEVLVIEVEGWAGWSSTGPG